MSRSDLAMLIIVLSATAIAAVAFFTTRYRAYRRAVAHGRRDAKPVWRPFWMN